MKNKILVVSVAVFLLGSIVAFYWVSKNREQEPLTIYVGVLYPEKSLDNLIDESDVIIIGKAEKVLPSRWSTLNGKRPRDEDIPEHTIYTDVVFQIDQVLKGDKNTATIFIRTFGGQVGRDQMTVSLEPQFKKEQFYLLFLSLDHLGSTADIGPEHYLTSGPKGVYEIIGNKAVSLIDEWSLEELVQYIQKRLQ